MKKAVIASGGKQYIVAEGDTVVVERIKEDVDSVVFDALTIIDGQNILVGTPLVKDVKVQATIVDANTRADKVTAIRYKAKKRVHKLHGHRQAQTTVRIDSISK
jgi:large subunit ribosomal protein L21